MHFCRLVWASRSPVTRESWIPPGLFRGIFCEFSDIEWYEEYINSFESITCGCRFLFRRRGVRWQGGTNKQGWQGSRAEGLRRGGLFPAESTCERIVTVQLQMDGCNLALLERSEPRPVCCGSATPRATVRRL